MNEEKIAFIQNILKWQKGSYVLSEQKCFIVNFGYKKPLDYPTVDYPDFPHFPFDFEPPSKCSIVVIEGRYLEQVDEVMRMVDKIPWMPLAVFLMAEKPGQDIQGKNKVSAQLEIFFFRWNPSGTFRNIPWFH